MKRSILTFLNVTVEERGALLVSLHHSGPSFDIETF